MVVSTTGSLPGDPIHSRHRRARLDGQSAIPELRWCRGTPPMPYPRRTASTAPHVVACKSPSPGSRRRDRATAADSATLRRLDAIAVDRSGRDSNPRCSFPHTAFPVRSLQPLGHRSRKTGRPRIGPVRQRIMRRVVETVKRTRRGPVFRPRIGVAPVLPLGFVLRYRFRACGSTHAVRL